MAGHVRWWERATIVHVLQASAANFVELLHVLKIHVRTVEPAMLLEISPTVRVDVVLVVNNAK